MAADILLFNANKIPIGPDQKQHVEIAIEIVKNLNKLLTNKISIPEPMINQSNSDVIIGIDGQKMSKNYNNTLPIFADEKSSRKKLVKFKRIPRQWGTLKPEHSCNVFKIIRILQQMNQDELKTNINQER